MQIQLTMRLIALCLCTISLGSIGLTAFAPAVQAAEEPAIEIPVTVSLAGAPPASAEDYTIVLAADHPAYPMPAGSAAGIYRTTITGEGAITLPEIEFPEPGVFTYRIYQEPGHNDQATYDDAVYELLVYVTQARHGHRLAITVIMYRVGQTEKLGEAEFVNCYDDAEPICPDKPDTSSETPGQTEPGTPEPTQPKTPEPAESEAPAEAGLPQTGDDTVIWPYIVLMVSGAGLLGLTGPSWPAKRVD